MDNFVRKPAEEQRVFIEEAAAQRDLTPVIIEKDFWVCWTLKRLASAPELEGQLTFKGGTSLSKAYGITHRFSEDIDLTIVRTAPFVCDVSSPVDDGISGKERKRRADALKVAAQNYVQFNVMPVLSRVIETALGSTTGWSVELDHDDPDAQTILFNYPRSGGSGLDFNRGFAKAEAERSYIKPRIKLEFGARGDTEPSEFKQITPYLAETFPDELPDAGCELSTLAILRTFWEKTTILHALHHNGKLRDGMSRHYYDTLMLARSGIADEALNYPALLAQVVLNKNLMFPDKSARYDTAVFGSLRTVPNKAAIASLKQDYSAMSEMFMQEPPSFADLLAGMEALEEKLNLA